MEAAEIDEGVGAEEEVGNDGGDGVEFSFGDPERGGTRRWGSATGAAWHTLTRWSLAQPSLDPQSTQPSHLGGESFAT